MSTEVVSSLCLLARAAYRIVIFVTFVKGEILDRGLSAGGTKA